MDEQYIPEGAESTLAQGEQGQDASADVTQGQDAQPNAQQVVQPGNDFDPKQFAYKYKGQEFSPKDRNHLTQLMSKGHSYEQSMAAVKQEQQRIAELQNRYKPYEQLDQMFKKNPQFQQELYALRDKFQNPQQPGQPSVPPEIQQKLEQFEQFQNNFVQQQANDALDKQIAGAKQKYGQYDWNTDDGDGNLETKVLKFMQESQIFDFEKGFRSYAFDMAQSRAQATGLQQAAQAQQQRHRQGVVDGGAPSVPPTPAAPPNYAKSSYGNLANMAKRELAGR